MDQQRFEDTASTSQPSQSAAAAVPIFDSSQVYVVPPRPNRTGELDQKTLDKAKDIGVDPLAVSGDLAHTGFNVSGLSFTGSGAEVDPSAIAPEPVAKAAEVDQGPIVPSGPRVPIDGYDPQALDRLSAYEDAAAAREINARNGYDLTEPEGRLAALNHVTQLAAGERFGPQASGAAALIAGALFAGPARLAQLVDILDVAHAGKELIQLELQELAAKLKKNRPSFVLSDLAFLQDRLHRLLRTKYGGKAEEDGDEGAARMRAVGHFLRGQPKLHDVYARDCQLLFVEAPAGEGANHAALVLKLAGGDTALYDPWPLDAGIYGDQRHVVTEAATVERYLAAAIVLRPPFHTP